MRGVRLHSRFHPAEPPFSAKRLRPTSAITRKNFLLRCKFSGVAGVGPKGINGLSQEAIDAAIAEATRVGFAVVRQFKPDAGTSAVASRFGRVIDIPRILNAPRIPTVQTLEPTMAEHSSLNRYSGHFGHGVFPLHTDLAHWHRPPRFFLLRCISGHSAVQTYVVPRRRIVEDVGEKVVSRAVCRPRRSRPQTPLCPAPIQFRENGIDGIRWDTVFLEPINACARELAERITAPGYVEEIASRVILENPGDVLLVDNWQALHGRGTVPEDATHRRIERAYIRLGD
ncbi:TauD/TfdA family dioxygenase [Roseovarius sp.]|uniref:TauD/TfdA family dioxygenase n=1 Tax=Roseovarius sp. TaxID=1486281 RepID=UPI0035627C8F